MPLALKPSSYSAYRGSKTARKKGMNEYLEAKKEAGTCEVAEPSLESQRNILQENLARPWRSVPIHPLSPGVRVGRGLKGT